MDPRRRRGTTHLVLDGRVGKVCDEVHWGGTDSISLFNISCWERVGFEGGLGLGLREGW